MPATPTSTVEFTTDEFRELIGQGYFAEDNMIDRNRDVWQYLDGVAARSHTVKDVGRLRRLMRNLIEDLWPLYQSNELSKEGRTLVESFLAQDNEFASVLQTSRKMSQVIPNLQLSPDQERRLLDQAQERARLKLLIIGGGVAVAGLMLLTALVAVIFFMFMHSA